MLCEIDGDLILKLNKRMNIIDKIRSPGPDLKQGYNFVCFLYFPLKFLCWFDFFMSAFFSIFCFF